MKKRILLIALALLMTLGCFAACTKDGDKKDGKSGGKITVDLGIWPLETQAEDVKFFKEMAEEFNEKYPNVTINGNHYTYATDNFVPMYEAETLPTIFETWYTEPKKLISNEYVKDISALYEKRGWKMDADVQAILSDEEGGLYGIPRDAYVFGIHCNKAVFKEAGLVDEDGYVKAPKTWEELAEYAQTIKEKTGKAGLVILAADKSGGWQFTEIAWCFGATFQEQDADGKWICNLNSKEAVAAMQFVYDLKWKYDAINDDPLQSKWDTGFEYIYTYRAGMYMAAQDSVDQYNLNSGFDKSDLAMIAIPEGPGGQVALLGGTPYMFPSYATDEQVEACFNFLELWGKVPVTDEASKANIRQGYEVKIVKGIPNITPYYCWDDEEYINLLDEIAAEYQNVDAEDFSSYYDMLEKEGVIRSEEPQLSQDMYNELTNVLQEVLTNKDCDIQKLMDTADSNFQKILDLKVNEAW